MTRRQLLGILSMLAATGVRVAAQKGPAVQVYKDPTCGCCSLWVEHLRKAGFSATVSDVEDIDAIKTKHGVPRQARSCHTAIVGGYAIEGHVPPATIKKFLAEHPKAAGLAVPGMPTGAPGMEMPGMQPDHYDVIAFQSNGTSTVYESH